MLVLEYRSSIYHWQLCFVLSFLLFVCLFFSSMWPATRDYHLLLTIKKINREHWLILTFLGGDKDEGDADHMESLSRPVSGERTSSHDDNESVGSVRPASGASGSITGK